MHNPQVPAEKELKVAKTASTQSNSSLKVVLNARKSPIKVKRSSPEIPLLRDNNSQSVTPLESESTRKPETDPSDKIEEMGRPSQEDDVFIKQIKEENSTDFLSEDLNTIIKPSTPIVKKENNSEHLSDGKKGQMPFTIPSQLQLGKRLPSQPSPQKKPQSHNLRTQNFNTDQSNKSNHAVENKISQSQVGGTKRSGNYTEADSRELSFRCLQLNDQKQLNSNPSQPLKLIRTPQPFATYKSEDTRSSNPFVLSHHHHTPHNFKSQPSSSQHNGREFHGSSSQVATHGNYSRSSTTHGPHIIHQNSSHPTLLGALGRPSHSVSSGFDQLSHLPAVVPSSSQVMLRPSYSDYLHANFVKLPPLIDRKIADKVMEENRILKLASKRDRAIIDLLTEQLFVDGH